MADLGKQSAAGRSNIVTFNVGGTRYEVSRSLLDQFPNSMLYKSASEQWQKDPDSEIFIERDGARFNYVLDYMRDGKVDVPMSETQASILAELEYFGVDMVDKNLVYYSKQAFSMNRCLEFIESLMDKKYGVTLAIFVVDEILKERKTLKPHEKRTVSLENMKEFKGNEDKYQHSIPQANYLLKNVGLKIVEIVRDLLKHYPYVPPSLKVELV